ncbi:unnamed protein product [Owenia fusiformis]|uniref:Choice-of-anchor B family protein n=1 Tax=Owenia fusiformis TaxID=6347 RepID=A0A8S4Q749_OWEFU|nr:unnamed protein product [Owenia fusiformis]
MMLTFVVLLAVGATAHPSCRYSEWDAWTQCTPNALCQSQRTQSLESYTSKTVSGVYQDQGRMNGEAMMEHKKRLWAGPNPLRTARESITGAAVDCTGGYASGFRCQNVNLQSFLSLQDLAGSGNTDGPSERGNDLWGWTDPTNNDEYVIMGLDDGTSFVRITDPVNPVVVAFLPTATVPSQWRDMKVVNDHAYIVSEAVGHGMQVFDLTRLRGQTDMGDVEVDFHYTEIGNTHNIVSNPASNTVFLVGSTDDSQACLAGLHMVDVSSPKNPLFAGCYWEDGYTHDAQCHIYNGPDTDYVGREICYNYNEDQLTIVDVTSKANPVTISTSGYPLATYTHQGWITEDHTMILLDDELDERDTFLDGNTVTYLWDVRDLDNPVIVGDYTAAHEAIDHNQYIRGSRVYQANYEVGLRILEIDQATPSLTEIGYFDVDDTSTGGTMEFQGAWTGYPYFASGNVPVSSIGYGLFIVRPDSMAMTETYQAGLNGTEQRERQLVAGDPSSCVAVKETRYCKASCH